MKFAFICVDKKTLRIAWNQYKTNHIVFFGDEVLSVSMLDEGGLCEGYSRIHDFEVAVVLPKCSSSLERHLEQITFPDAVDAKG
jgi:hypothetical protein